MTGVPGTAAETPAADQERAVWTLHRLAAGRGISNIGFGLRVDGALRWWPLQEALDHLARRHPGLRTVFTGTAADLRRRVAPAEDAHLTLESVAGTEDGLAALVTETVAEPFDLEAGPLVRARLVVLPAGSVVCFAAHHIVADWTSSLGLLHELARLYDAACAGGEPPADLAGEAPEAEHPRPGAEDLAYWAEQLAGADPDAQALAGARPVPSPPTFAGGRIDAALSAEAAAAVARLRARTRSSDNIVMLAAYCVLLARHGAGPDLVVGVPVSTRRSGAPDALGYHISTLPIRVRTEPGQGFDELVKTVRAAFLGGLEHSAASTEQVQHLAGARTADWRAPLFRHTFNYRPVSADDDGITLGGLPARHLDAGHGMSRLDLDLVVFAGPRSLELTAVYSTEAHDRARIENLVQRYERLLIALDADPGAAVGSVDLRTEADRWCEEALNAGGRVRPGGAAVDGSISSLMHDGAAAGFGSGDSAAGGAPVAGDGDAVSSLSVAELIHRQAVLTPEAPAVGGWTYRHLLEAAGGIATALTAARVAPGDVVGLHLDRGPLLAACALGVWTVGAAYLPLDPAHPAERSAFQLDDGGVRVLLSDLPVPEACAAGRTVLRPEGLTGPVTAPTTGPLAYLVYTSGSTGRPKGVEVGHRALANVVGHFADLLEVRPDDRFLWLTTFSFDISALEVFLPLTVGAAVVPAADRDRLSARDLVALLGAERVSLVQATPTTWRFVEPELGPGQLRGLRVLSGGEALTADLAERLLAAGGRLFNVYGPSETTIWSTAAEITAPVGDRTPIGRPIAGTTATVRDAAGQPLPPGVPGELCLGGTGLADGYRADPVLTAERFVATDPAGRYYRTGDRVVLTADGTLDYLGRLDRQLKIRGQRIEPGEVEAVFEAHPEVASAAAFAVAEPSGEKALTVAVRPAADTDADSGAAADGDAGAGLAARLRAYAELHLPSGAVPSRIVAVSAFPLTGNAKIDYRALAASITTAPEAELPADPAVRTIVEVWRDILGEPGIGPDSQFFLSGGHSLAAARVAERLTTAFGVEIGFDLVFEAPTPVRLAARITELGGTP